MSAESFKQKIKGWLSRESSSGQFIPEIDGLRFIAIMSVILYHLNGHVVIKSGRTGEFDFLSSFFDKGSFGVPLFFVISGFIISYPFAKRILAGNGVPPLKKYYLRRLTRLEPPYIFNLFLMYFLLIMVKSLSPEELFPHLIASIFYNHNFIYGEHSLINGVAWSLEVECQFYILAPLLTSVFRIRSALNRRILLLSIILFLSFFGFYFLLKNPRLRLSILYYANYFITGFLLADIYLTDWKESPCRNLMWDVISILSWGSIAVLLYSPELIQNFLPVVILVAYCAAFKGTYSNRFFCNPVIYIIGGMCYTTYLYHFYIISAVGRIGMRFFYVQELPIWINLLIMGAAVVPVVLVICSVFFIFTEKPFMKKEWHKVLIARLLPVSKD